MFDDNSSLSRLVINGFIRVVNETVGHNKGGKLPLLSEARFPNETTHAKG